VDDLAGEPAQEVCPISSEFIHISLAVKAALPASGASFRATEAAAPMHKEAAPDGGRRLDVPASNSVTVEIKVSDQVADSN
jgi:hypothetical protein